MRKAVGIGCIVLGVACLISSVGLVFFNRFEDSKAQESSRHILHSAQLVIQEQKEPSDQPVEEAEQEIEDKTEQETESEISEDKTDSEMPTVSVEGYDCIGILSIPVLELELPVFADWSYEKLKVAPCHYYGSYKSGDFVIAAHNYKSHFGRLSELQPKDLVLFTDALGEVHQYEVVLLETLSANATKEMISSGFDLSLYTCTSGGNHRVTVRCISKSF